MKQLKLGRNFVENGGSAAEGHSGAGYDLQNPRHGFPWLAGERQRGRAGKSHRRLVAGLIISQATHIPLTTAGGPMQLPSMLAFVAAIGLGVWLLISILRGTHAEKASGRTRQAS